ESGQAHRRMEHVHDHHQGQPPDGGPERRDGDRERRASGPRGSRPGGAPAPREQGEGREVDQPAGAGAVPEHLDQGAEVGGNPERPRPAGAIPRGFFFYLSSGFFSSTRTTLYSWSRFRITSAFMISSPICSASAAAWPVITRPNTVCFPLSQSVGMKV